MVVSILASGERSVLLRDAAETDATAILAINAACSPAVSELTEASYVELCGWAERVLVADAGGLVAGFMILMRPGAAYASDNYAWFAQRFDRFLYVDRIAIEAGGRGNGLGRMLYEEALRLAEVAGDRRLCAEVNEVPPNPESLAFHTRLGFRHLESRTSRSGKVVAMLERPLAG